MTTLGNRSLARSRLLGMALITVALAATAYLTAASATDSAGLMARTAAIPSLDPTPSSLDPTPSETPSEPTPSPSEPTPSPSESTPVPDPGCPIESATPTDPPALALATFTGTAHVSRVAAVGPVTCEDSFVKVTVKRDDKKLNISTEVTEEVAKGCKIKDRTVVEPKGGKLNNDGTLDVPYGADPVTAVINVDVECTLDGKTIVFKRVVTVTFTPPDTLAVKIKGRD